MSKATLNFLAALSLGFRASSTVFSLPPTFPHGEDIEAFLKREIAKPIIRWEETKKDGQPILGYEILPNKYFYRYQPPAPAQALLAEFWRLEKEAEKMLEGLAR